MPLILLFIQYSFNAQHVSAVYTTIFRSLRLTGCYFMGGIWFGVCWRSVSVWLWQTYIKCFGFFIFSSSMKNCFRFTAVPLFYPRVPITVSHSILSPCYVLPPVVSLLLAMDNAHFRRDHINSIPRSSRIRPPIFPLTLSQVTFDGLRMCITRA